MDIQVGCDDGKILSPCMFKWPTFISALSHHVHQACGSTCDPNFERIATIYINSKLMAIVK